MSFNNLITSSSGSLVCAACVSIGGCVEWHGNHNVLDHVVSRIEATHVSSIVFASFIGTLLLPLLLALVNDSFNLDAYGP